jgi:protein tyrosine/serine phosphatase
MRYRFINITRKTLLRSAFGLLVGGSVVAAYFLILQSRGNFHEIIPGELYRSAQLSPEQLEKFAKNYKIQTIINLRGSNPNDAWYQQETAVATKLQLKHIDYPISRKYTITSTQVKELTDILRTAPKPVLIHCKAGIDRTGFVSALYIAAVAKQPKAEALEQFCLHYGFVALESVAGYKMFESFNALKAELL